MAKSDLKQDLIDSILNEELEFNMCLFKRGTQACVATCSTATCMAGHIEAVRPRLARKLKPKYVLHQGPSLDHASLAAEIWEIETGEKCRLDFFACNNPKAMHKITRREAVAHIRGTSKRWPQLLGVL